MGRISEKNRIISSEQWHFWWRDKMETGRTWSDEGTLLMQQICRQCGSILKYPRMMQNGQIYGARMSAPPVCQVKPYSGSTQISSYKRLSWGGPIQPQPSPQHSPTCLTLARLQSIQEQFGMPPKRLQQDVSTSWNCTCYMLESLVAQKRVLAAYTADYDLPTTFTSYQWLLIENILSLLAPFQQLTNKISSSDASVADVIPSLAALRHLLSKEA